MGTNTNDAPAPPANWMKRSRIGGVGALARMTAPFAGPVVVAGLVWAVNACNETHTYAAIRLVRTLPGIQASDVDLPGFRDDDDVERKIDDTRRNAEAFSVGHGQSRGFGEELRRQTNRHIGT